MARLLPILTSMVPLAAAPATAAAAPANTGAQTSQQQASVALSSLLHDRTINGDVLVRSLYENFRKLTVSTNANIDDVQAALVFGDFMAGMSGRFATETLTLQEAIHTSFLNAPLTNSLSTFLIKFRDFVKANPGIAISNNDADKQKLSDFIIKFKEDCEKLTDHSITTLQSVNAMATTASNEGIVLNNPPANIAVSSLGTYFVAEKINAVPGDNLLEYFNELGRQGSTFADYLNATVFDDSVSMDFFKLITENGVVAPVQNLVTNAAKIPQAEVAKYGLSTLVEKFDAEIEKIKISAANTIRNLFNTFDGARTKDNFKAITDELAAEGTSTTGSSPIATAIATAKDTLLTELHNDINTMLAAHVDFLAFNDVKTENIDKLTIDKIIKPAAWKTFIDKWNKSNVPTSFNRTIVIKPGALPTNDAEATITLTIKDGSKDAVTNPVVDANGTSIYKWNSISIPVKITLKDLIIEIQKLADKNNLGAPSEDDKITTLNFGSMLTGGHDVPSLHKFDNLIDLMRLFPNLVSVYPEHGATNTTDRTFLDKFPELNARIVAAKVLTTNSINKTADIETEVRFYKDNADYLADANYETIKLVAKSVPVYDPSLVNTIGEAFRKMIEATDPDDATKPIFFGLELLRLFELTGTDVIAQQTATSLSLQFDDLTILLGQKSETGDFARGFLTEMLEDGQKPLIANPLDAFPKLGDYKISGSIVATKSATGWTAHLSNVVVTSKIDDSNKSATLSANVTIITLDQFIKNAINDFNKDAQPFLDLASQLHSDGMITDDAYAKVVKAINDAKQALSANLTKPEVKSKDDVLKVLEDARKALKLTQVEAIASNLPNATNQTDAARKEVANAEAALVAAQTALDAAKQHENDVNNNPSSTDAEKAAALAATQAAQDAFVAAKENFDKKTEVLAEILKHIGAAAEVVSQAANKASDVYGSILAEAANYLNTADLSSLDEFEAFKKLADMPLFDHVNLSMPMKYALIGLGGLMGLVGLGTTFSSIRSIKTNRNISQIGENASIEYQKPKKTMVLKAIVSVAAIGAAASIITLVLTLGGGL